MKYILLLIGINWLLWTPVLVLWLNSRHAWVQRYANVVVAVYLSIVLAAWLTYRGSSVALTFFVIAATVIFATWMRQAMQRQER